MCNATRSIFTVTAALAIWGGAMLFGLNASAHAETSPSVHKVSMSSQSPAWAERLKGQNHHGKRSGRTRRARGSG